MISQQVIVSDLAIERQEFTKKESKLDKNTREHITKAKTLKEAHSIFKTQNMAINALVAAATDPADIVDLKVNFYLETKLSN